MILRFYLALSIIFNGVLANTPATNQEKKSVPDDLKSQNVSKTQKQFLFKEVIVSINQNNETPLQIIFDLIVDREQNQSLTSQEDDIPRVIDSILSDLFPTLNLFHQEIHKELNASLEKRIFRVLKAKFEWIERVEVQNLRIQEVNR